MLHMASNGSGSGPRHILTMLSSVNVQHLLRRMASGALLCGYHEMLPKALPQVQRRSSYSNQSYSYKALAQYYYRYHIVTHDPNALNARLLRKIGVANGVVQILCRQMKYPHRENASDASLWILSMAMLFDGPCH